MYLLTLTAPGDRQHSMPSGDVCPCTPEGGVNLAEWNPTAAARWNVVRTALRREVPDLQYLRAVEVQEGQHRADRKGRGALHLHVIVWSPTSLDRVMLRRLAMRAGFGHSLDLAEIEPGSRKHAYYVAKYVTKACDARTEVPWMADVLDEDTGELQRLHTVPTYRTWSSSAAWGLTMKQIRAICAAAAARRAATLAALPQDTGNPAPAPVVAVCTADLGPPG